MKLAGLVLTFIAALRFSFFSFIKTLAEKYHLLLILGIKAKDFWRLAVKEYFSEVFLLGIKAILYSNVVCIAITYFIFRSHATINYIMAFKQFFLTVLLVFLLYTAVLSLTMAAIMYHRRKKSLIEFFDQFSQELSKGHTSEKGQLLKPVSGAAFLILSFLLLIDFRVEKMILAVFINIFGAFLLIHSDGDLIKGGIKKFKHMYYKKILVWGDLLYQYKVNSHLIFILYTLNFFLVYFMGGLILSVDSGEVSEKYPYETIIYSDINLYPQNTYHVLSVNIPGYGSAAAISNVGSVTQEGINVIQDLSLQIKESEVFGIVGKSGCGKTTLLKILGGMLKPTSGQVFYQDDDIYQYSNEKLEDYRRLCVGTVFQDYKLLDHISIRENIMLPAILNHNDIDYAIDKAESIAETLGIERKLDRYSYELSGGEKQRAAIGRALINDPNVILADEPTGNLDPKTTMEVIELLLEIKNTFKKTIILVTHDMELGDYCDRIINMSQGEITMEC